MSPRVFIVEAARPDVDISTSVVFGELVEVFPPYRRGGRPRPENIHRSSAFDPAAYTRELTERLEKLDYRPDVDYFMITGALLPVALAVMVLSIRYTRFKTLVFNTGMSKYVEKTFDGYPLKEIGHVTTAGSVR